MENLKKELIDFIEKLSTMTDKLNYYDIQRAKSLLKSLNSLPNGEASNVSTNELTKEDFNCTCNHKRAMFYKGIICKGCGKPLD